MAELKITNSATANAGRDFNVKKCPDCKPCECEGAYNRHREMISELNGDLEVLKKAHSHYSDALVDDTNHINELGESIMGMMLTSDELGEEARTYEYCIAKFDQHIEEMDTFLKLHLNRAFTLGKHGWNTSEIFKERKLLAIKARNLNLTEADLYGTNEEQRSKRSSLKQMSRLEQSNDQHKSDIPFIDQVESSLSGTKENTKEYPLKDDHLKNNVKKNSHDEYMQAEIDELAKVKEPVNQTLIKKNNGPKYRRLLKTAIKQLHEKYEALREYYINTKSYDEVFELLKETKIFCSSTLRRTKPGDGPPRIVNQMIDDFKRMYHDDNTSNRELAKAWKPIDKKFRRLNHEYEFVWSQIENNELKTPVKRNNEEWEAHVKAKLKESRKFMIERGIKKVTPFNVVDEAEAKVQREKAAEEKKQERKARMANLSSRFSELDD